MTALIYDYFSRSFILKLLSIGLMVLLADFLFYRQETGWTIGLYGWLLTCLFVLHNQSCLQRPLAKIIFILTLGQCLLLVEKQSLLCCTLMASGIISLVLMRQNKWHKNALINIKRISGFFFVFLGPLFRALGAYQRKVIKHIPQNSFEEGIRNWFLPIIFTFLFVCLFSEASPLWQKWFSQIDLSIFLKSLSGWRVSFWFLAAGIIFAVIRPKARRRNTREEKNKTDVIDEPPTLLSWIFTEQAVKRSLILFNLLFAVQTVMDVTYLWGGQKLPDGITYAQYAHKGAYPLIVTALLAAAFVLIAQNQKKDPSKISWVDYMIYLWVGQNIFLVFSSIYRTMIYVDIYSLTYWRVAALIWMGLVAGGLMLIILRSIYKKSSLWLININVIMLFAVLYITSLLNLGSMIAHYNVQHSKEISGQGQNLDMAYLYGIGPSAIPALEEYLKLNPTYNGNAWLAGIKTDLKRDMMNWRRWTYSEYRLSILDIKAGKDGHK